MDQDGDEPSIWDDHRVIGGRDEEDGDEMGAPRWAGMQRLPGTSNVHTAQVRCCNLCNYPRSKF